MSMYANIRCALSLLALAGLLHGPAAAATDVARLPLKASVLAKPNVIFGMDDSGSMDWEVLLDTNSGKVWWDGSSGWDTGAGRARVSSGFVPYSFLFPVGTATGGQIYAYNSTNGQSAPPIDQLAWVRSAKFNPMYYDTMVTYLPWAPAYVDAATRTYPDASVSAALSHPAYTSGPTLRLDAAWSSASPNWDNTTGAYRFYVQAGMTLPVGTKVGASSTSSGACESGTERTLTASVTVANGRACWASIPYRPATFWHAQSCTPGPDCITAPDGVTLLKRYEIKPAVSPAVDSYPSGRSYAKELQNFANWFTYYRKRKLMLAGAMGEVLEGLTGVRLGVVPFNDRTTVSMKDTDNISPASNGQWIAGKFYKNAMIGQGTPTHKTVKYIGDQYNGNSSIVEYACQRNNMFVVTDGFANSHSETTPFVQRCHIRCVRAVPDDCQQFAGGLRAGLLHQPPAHRPDRRQGAGELVDGTERRQEQQPARQHLRHLARRPRHHLAQRHRPVHHGAGVADAGR